MKRIVEAIAMMLFLTGASAMDSTRVAIPSMMVIGGIAIIFITERSYNNVRS